MGFRVSLQLGTVVDSAGTEPIAILFGPEIQRLANSKVGRPVLVAQCETSGRLLTTLNND